MHSGVPTTVSALKAKYFIPKISSVVAKILRTCTICKKANGNAYRYPNMPTLPKERVTRCRPFQKTGLDYLGPLPYRNNSGAVCKAWVCLYTCMATRAVHLETVKNNTATECFMAFRRFSARRGIPEVVISDN